MWKQAAGNVAASLPRQVSIVGAQGFATPRSRGTTTDMIATVLRDALDQAQLRLQDLDGLIAVPSLQEHHFMEAHYQATRLGLFAERPQLRCKTIDTGGAGPVTALLEGVRMIRDEGLECVAVVAADKVGSMDAEAFLSRADDIFLKLQQQPERTLDTSEAPFSPAIPYGYDKLTAYQMERYGVTRDQLRMAVCLESWHAGQHPGSVYRQKQTASHPRMTCLQTVQDAPAVTPHISLLECARRADGAACLVLASNRCLARQGLYRAGLPTVIGGGESSGPLYPASSSSVEESHFSCEQAMGFAYASAGNLTADDIDFFGLYDCFPICLVRALEAAGLCEKGGGGRYLEEQYRRLVAAIDRPQDTEPLTKNRRFFPVNTHGGLLCYGAPWEVPAMFNIIEAVEQLEGRAKGRVIDNCRRALIYGNGGILSASAVAILSKSL